MRQIPGNLYSHKVPGGNLIMALFDRQLMMWSDRGGASRYFGDQWSERVSAALSEQIGTERALPDGGTYCLSAVVRLDDDTRIAIQAGRHKLTNPDFVLFGRADDGEPLLQAADAKFAVDTIKPPQVSADALQALLDVEGGLVRVALNQTIQDPDVVDAVAVRGVFVSPIGALTDFFLPRLMSDPALSVDRSQVELISADPSTLFAGLPPAPLVGTLARIDRLRVSPRTDLLAAMYYFRVACACSWMWIEERTPLLSKGPAPEVIEGELLAEVGERARSAESAYDLAVQWFEVVEEVARTRRALNEVMSLPVRMGELRQMVEAAGAVDDRKTVRIVRAALDQRFRQRVLDEAGEIPAHPAEPIGDVLLRVADVSRALRSEMSDLARSLVAEHAARGSLVD